MAAAGVSTAVTLVAVLGGVGLVPAGSPASLSTPAAADAHPGVGAGAAARSSRRVVERPVLTNPTALPPASGHGRRVVFSESAQRVWLVGERGRVLRTYPVSGSLHDNLDPGTYEVYSRSEQAWGIDDSGTMRWFVRFTRGERAAIGFHSIPEVDGRPVQAAAQLGTPLSHGCIRQRLADARALWNFAPLGTTVVVVA
jgi:hypothetical protein